MFKKDTIIKTLNNLLLILILLFIACVSSSPPRDQGITSQGMNSNHTDNTETKVPKMKDKIVIPDETSIPENNPESMEMAAAGSNDTTSNTGTRSNSLNTTPIVPFTHDVPIQENNDRINEPAIIIRSTPKPELPETQSPGDVWVEDRNVNTKVGNTFKTAIHVNTGTKHLAAYGFTILYSSKIIALDESAKTKVEAGSQGFVAAVNTNDAGIIKVSGFDAAGKMATPDLELFIVYWKALAKGSSYITLSIDTLTNEKYETIGDPRAINGMVIVN